MDLCLTIVLPKVTLQRETLSIAVHYPVFRQKGSAHMRRLLSKRRLIISLCIVLLLSFSFIVTPSGVLADVTSISVNPTQGAPGTVVTVMGVGWTPGDTVDLSLDAVSTLATATVAGDGTFTATITIPTGTTGGKHFVDAINAAGDTTAQAPFTATTTSPTVDLQTVDIQPLQPLTEGSNPTFRAYIQNNGTAASGIFNIRWIADGTMTFDGSHESLAPGATTTQDHIWSQRGMPPLTPGNHTLTFIANFDHQVPESNYDNNEFTLPFTVAPTPTPTLPPPPTPTPTPTPTPPLPVPVPTPTQPVTPTPTSTTTPTPLPTPTPIKPGGRWITPSNNFSVTQGQTLQLSAHAYPTNNGDPAIAYVEFTAYWSGANSSQWPVLVKVNPTAGTDVFSYTWDLTYQGNPIPSGSIQVSFNVYDVAGNKNLAPNGIHDGTVTNPTPTLQADLAATMTTAWKSTGQGGKFLYQIVVRNNGPADTTGVRLTDNLPSQFYPIIGDIITSQGRCPLPPGGQFPITVTCQLGNLSVSQSATVFFAVGINTGSSVQPGMVTNTAKVEGDLPDPNPNNNLSSVTTEITKPSELTADELNASLRLAYNCGEVFTDLPLFGETTNLIDRFNGHQMSSEEALSSLSQDTLDLIALKYHSVDVLTKFLGIPACVSYSREIFSIGQ